MSTSNWYNSTIKYTISDDIVVTDEWRQLVTTFEGLSLEAYQDSVGVWTIGYGHTLGVKRGMVITEAQADQLLFKDVDRFEASVNRLVSVPLTQYQFNALVSFTFNVGGSNLKSSTLLKRLNLLDYDGAADEFSRWVYAGGKVLNGLKRRRAAEAAMFRGEEWGFS